MSNIHVVMDSTAHADLAWLASHPKVHVVPLSVELAGREYKEDQLEAEDLFTLIQKQGVFPKTSQPAPGLFQSVYEPLLAEGAEIIVITLSSALSGTVRSAELAKSLCASERIHVIDSATTANGMVKLAEYILAAAEQGDSTSEILSAAAEFVARTHTFFVPGTLEYLYKGGRIGGAAALFGGILKIRPVLQLVAGKVEILDKVRTRSRALERMIEEINKMEQQKSIAHLGVVHIAAPEEALALVKDLSERFPAATVSLSTGGSVLAAHLGPGLLGVVFQQTL